VIGLFFFAFLQEIRYLYIELRYSGVRFWQDMSELISVSNLRFLGVYLKSV